MNGNGSYINIARKDLIAAKEMLRADMYNHAVRLCQQYVEKVFKECIHQKGKNENDMLLLHMHRLPRLAERCSEITNIKFTKLEIAFFRELTDYYFDTNYPGENYIEVSKADALRAYDETMDFKNAHEDALCL